MYVPSLKGWKECLLVSFIQTAIEGTLNVLRQAEKAGITKIVVTGTFGNTIDRKLFNDTNRKINRGEGLTFFHLQSVNGPSFCWKYYW
jgi:nucleoside-diphosphate-sugar epimerase